MSEITADWTPSLAEFTEFAALSGDDNPIHLDPTFCATTAFARPVAHGMLLYAKLWALLPHAEGQNFRTIALKFPNPAYAGEPLALALAPTATGYRFTATRRADGQNVLEGEAVRA